MEKKHKVYLKLNLMSLFFIAVSFISVTLAWFAYSGLASVETEIGVKAWYIEFQKGAEEVSNNIVISLSEIYPGMETVNEVVNIKNLGDSDAQLNYSIVSARILDNEYVPNGSTITSDYLEDALSHDYPFHININLSKYYALSGGDESVFDVSISWPLDSDTNEIDSEWGTNAYKFQQSEQEKYNLDNSYQVRQPIKIVISVTAEQYIESLTSSDPEFNLGDIVLYDVANNTRCTEIDDYCIKTYVISSNSTIGDNNVLLLPELYDTYSTGKYSDYSTKLMNVISGWGDNVKSLTRELKVDDLMNVISNDILQSKLIRANISDSIIGTLKYNNRMTTELSKAIAYNGYYSFNNQKFNYLSSSKCYWTKSEYNTNKAFAFTKVNENSGKIYGEDKNTECSIVPVISVPKSNLKG